MRVSPIAALHCIMLGDDLCCLVHIGAMPPERVDAACVALESCYERWSPAILRITIHVTA